MGKTAVRVSYKGTDFKEFFTIALIFGRSIPGPEGYFCSRKIAGRRVVRQFKIHIMKILRPGIGKFLSFLLLFSLAIPFFGFRSRVPGWRPNLTSHYSISIASSHTLIAKAAAHFNLLYDSLGLEALNLSREAYVDAVQGFLALQANGLVHNSEVLSIIDFSLPSTAKRLFIIDMQNGRLLFNTFVAHGRNSGILMATRFSNRFNSFMSSLGFYVTGDPFMGRNGYSLRLEGVEHGINDHALSRSIIMHPADYVSEEHIQRYGYLGRSEGCPAIPEALDQPIIDEIKGGSCLFFYAPNARYLRRSNILD
jgi:hypothetical protein